MKMCSLTHDLPNNFGNLPKSRSFFSFFSPCDMPNVAYSREKLCVKEECIKCERERDSTRLCEW